MSIYQEFVSDLKTGISGLRWLWYLKGIVTSVTKII